MMSRLAFGFSLISLLLNVYRTFALVPFSWLSNRLSHKRLFLNESPLDAESKEVFNENDNSLTGEPRWFNPTVQSEIPDELAEVNMVDKGIILRSLPIYLLNDDQCFPTGRLTMKINNQYCTMMEDILRTDKMFGVVMSDGKGQFCDVGTAVENIKQEIYRGGSQKLENVCRQRFRILKINQVEPYLIADVAYGFSDVDVLEAELNGGELSDDVLNIEREIYQILCDVISLTNKLFEEENSEGINRGEAVLGLSNAVKLLSPQKHLFRLSVASDFSFAVSDMIGASSRLKQLLLQSSRLDTRLLKIKTALINARSYLIDRIDAYDEPFN